MDIQYTKCLLGNMGSWGRGVPVTHTPENAHNLQKLTAVFSATDLHMLDTIVKTCVSKVLIQPTFRYNVH